jgi:hypothetical protein
MDHAPEAKFEEPKDNRKRAGYGKFLRPNTAYDNFMESQGIPIYRDIGVRRVQDLPRKPWKRMGGTGTFIQLLGTEGLWGCYVVEVPGAGALNPEKHLYEEQYLVVEGRGRSVGRRQPEETHLRMAERFDLRHTDERHPPHRQCDFKPSSPARRHDGAECHEQFRQP